MILTLTYGDPSPLARDAIGNHLRRVLDSTDATIYCDRFTGQGSWTDATGTTYTEHSGVIVADVSLKFHDHLRLNVAETALRYDQDAIGFVVSSGANSLVTPAEAAR